MMEFNQDRATGIQAEVHREMEGVGRLQMAVEMSEAVRELALTRLRHERPGWSEWECRRELIRYAFLPRPMPERLR